MTFKAYDILSSLVPGFILLLAILNFLHISYDKDYTVAYTAVAFLLGYTVNTIGSWLEDFYFYTWGGKPSSNLLNGKSIWKVKLYNAKQIRQHLTQKISHSNPNHDELFSLAIRDTSGQKDTRIEDFNAMYAFSRTLLTAAIICGVLLLIRYYYDWRYYALVLPIITILWLRCKQRGYYYSKEVLNVYSKINNL